MPADPSAPRPAEVAAFLAAHGDTRFIEAFTPDLTGYGFGKRLPVEEIEKLQKEVLDLTTHLSNIARPLSPPL